MANIFDGVPRHADMELFTDLLCRDGVRIERIVSTGHTTPADQPFNQPHDEWILLLAGAARLLIDGEAEHVLRPGDHRLILANRPHRVTWTDPHGPTIWLAVHLG